MAPDRQSSPSDHARTIIRFLFRCYRADNRDPSLLDIFSRKVEYRSFLPEPDALIHGVSPVVDVADPTLEKAHQRAALYRREKALVLASRFVVGRYTVGARERVLCAPLLVGPATVEPGLVHPFVSADLESIRYNAPLLRQLMASIPGPKESLDALLDALPAPPIDSADLAPVLRRRFPTLDVEGLVARDHHPMPETTSHSVQNGKDVLAAVRKARRSAHVGSFRCVPGSCIALVHRSIDTRGVLGELRELADAPTYSEPLRLLVGYSPEAAPKPDAQASPTPSLSARLSEPQQRVVDAARRAPLTVVVGPPGTGKSFTIATVALDAAARGESVLIASKMDHAVDVVADKIDQQLGAAAFVIRAGRKNYARTLKRDLNRLLSGFLPITPRPEDKRQQLLDGRKNLRREARGLEAQLERRTRDEVKWGVAMKAYREAPNWLLRWWRGNWVQVRHDRLMKGDPYALTMRRYLGNVRDQIKADTAVLRDDIARRLKRTLEHHRRDLVRFSSAIRARASARQEKLFDATDLGTLLKTFPIWQTNLTDVASTVPQAESLFDLVILDEASQCDMAACLPILQRGRRAVIVGDPHQLRHLSFLARRRQHAFGIQLGLAEEEVAHYDYRERSVLDLALDMVADQRSVIVLDEHFRSAPPIIQFSNQTFYHDQLRIMQERPTPPDPSCLVFRRVDGRRETSGANPVEVDAVIDTIRALTKEDRTLDPNPRRSIGVISPFAAQVDAISTALIRAGLGRSIEQHNIMVGTPFGFQGEEREVVILSLAVDPESHAGAFRFINRPDVFNVAITRARSRQIIITSVSPGDGKLDGLLLRYLRYAATASTPRDDAPTSPSDGFAEALQTRLEERGWTVNIGYPIAGFVVDLVATRTGFSLGIDLVGHPGPFAPAFDTERYRIFARTGLPIVPVTYSSWCHNTTRVLDKIEAMRPSVTI